MYSTMQDAPVPVRSTYSPVSNRTGAVQLRPPYEARADAVMYRRVLAAVAEARGWAVAFYDARTVEARAAAILGSRADRVLHGPRDRLGPPWARDLQQPVLP